MKITDQFELWIEFSDIVMHWKMVPRLFSLCSRAIIVKEIGAIIVKEIGRYSTMPISRIQVENIWR